MKILGTFLPDIKTAQKKCYVIDAADQILGRVAAKAAHYLRGKHRTDYTTFLDSGDLIVIINADKIKVTGKKLTDKIYQRYSGYPSGQRRIAFGDLMEKAPTEALRLAVNRMIPKGPLGNTIRGRLRVYAGNENPHIAQKPIVVTL